MKTREDKKMMKLALLKKLPFLDTHTHTHTYQTHIRDSHSSSNMATLPFSGAFLTHFLMLPISIGGDRFLGIIKVDLLLLRSPPGWLHVDILQFSSIKLG